MGVTPDHSTAPDATLDTVTILLVDDDEHWAWATSRLLEREEAFSVTTAHSVDAGRERFEALDPDCVVCDYDLGDDDGLALLETVRGADPDRPFVLVTGKGDEAVASSAIGRGVTDYIRKGQDDEDDVLASRVRNLVRTYRSQRALDRQRRTKTAFLEVLRKTASETDLCREFCRQLVHTEAYALAWIATATGTSDPVPRATAGRDAYVDAIADQGELPADEPGRLAYDRTDTVVSAVDPDEPADGWQAIAAEHGLHRCIAVPIRYEGVTFGVLAVYLAAEATAATETDVVEEYAESIGYALRSFDRKRSLLSAQPVRVEVTVTDRVAPLVALAERLSPCGKLTSPSVVTRRDGTTVYLAHVEDVSRAAVEATVAELPELTLLDADASAGRVTCALAASGTTPEGTLVDQGARFERTVVDDGVATVSVRIPEDKRVADVAAGMERYFEGATVSTVWTDPHSRPVTDDPFAELTDKQRTVLRHAFHEGYFERPRGANATEVADRLGISRQTFTQHLRAAQRKVFGAWQATER